MKMKNALKLSTQKMAERQKLVREAPKLLGGSLHVPILLVQDVLTLMTLLTWLQASKARGTG
jgi:hypothetical protein